MSSPLLPRLLLLATVGLSAAAGFKCYQTGHELIAKNDEVKVANEKADKQLTAAKQTLEEAKTAKEQLKAVSEAKANLDAQVNANAVETAKLKQQASDAQAKATEAQSQIRAKDDEMTDLKRKLADATAAAAASANPTPVTPAVDPEMAKKVSDAEAKVAAKDLQIKTLESQLAQAERQAASRSARNRDGDSTSSSLPSNSAAFTPGISTFAPRVASRIPLNVRGQVLAVSPAWNFIVMSVGNQQGVSSGSILLVRRGSNLLGQVRVSSVQPSISVGNLQGGANKAISIQPGDEVIAPGI